MESMPLELDKPLILPDELRVELQKVHGELVSEGEVKKYVRGNFVITVGDVVTYTLLKLGLDINVAVVDYKTKRSEVIFEDIKKFGDIFFKVKNPAGTITPELWKAVRDAIESKKRTRIDVEGEEDLAVLPAVLFAPQGAIVIYGMPNTGLVILKVKDEDKKSAMEIIKRMEV